MSDIQRGNQSSLQEFAVEPGGDTGDATPADQGHGGQVPACGESLVLGEAFVTSVAGHFYHAETPATPGEPVRLLREPGNDWDSNAIAVHDAEGRRIGYLRREVAAQYAALVDAGCVRISGRLAAQGEPGYDAECEQRGPALCLWVYVDGRRLAEILDGQDPTRDES